MSLSSESIIALVALLFTVPPSLLVIWKICRGRSHDPTIVGAILPRHSASHKHKNHYLPSYRLTRWSATTSIRVESVVVTGESPRKHRTLNQPIKDAQYVAKIGSIRRLSGLIVRNITGTRRGDAGVESMRDLGSCLGITASCAR
jgi:hypothetical protein